MEKFICKDNVIVIINIDFLKESIITKDAEILKMLFGIKKDSNFGDFPLERDEDSNILILKKLDIESNDWYQFLSFLKNGFPPYYSKEIFKDTMKRNFFIENLENINQVCNKLGGIPYFDKFYTDFYNTLNEEISSCKNPTDPIEDVNNLFLWGLGKTTHESFSSSYNAYPSGQGWSITKYFTDDNEKYFWTRKKI